MLTRNSYKEIGQILIDVYSSHQNLFTQALMTLLIDKLCIYFSKDNPNFNKKQFLNFISNGIDEKIF